MSRHPDPRDGTIRDVGPVTAHASGDAPGSPAPAPREPADDRDRQGIEMSRHPDPHDHPAHDLELVAAHVAGDATGLDLEAATTLIATCPECATLHRDLRAIAAALPELPAPVRHRDFRLSEDQAAALRTNRWRRLVGVLAGPRFSFAAPLGTGLATLGIAVLVVSGSLGLPFATGGATSAERAVSGQQFAAQSPMPTGAPALDGNGAVASQPIPPAGPTGGHVAAATAAPATASGAPAAPTADSGTDTSAGDGTDTTNTGGDIQAEGAPTAGGKSSTGSDFGAQPAFDGRDLPLAVGIVAFLIGLALVVLRQLVRRLA